MSDESDRKLCALHLSVYAIVAALQAPSNVSKIKREFEESMGESIPFENYGFSTLEELLDKNDKLFSIIQDGEKCYSGKYSTKCGNILDLVSGQKNKKKKKVGSSKDDRGNFRLQRSFSAKTPSTSFSSQKASSSSGSFGCDGFSRPTYTSFTKPLNFSNFQVPPASSRSGSSNIMSRITFKSKPTDQRQLQSENVAMFTGFKSETTCPRKDFLMKKPVIDDKVELTSVRKIDLRKNGKNDKIDDFGGKILNLLKELNRPIYPLQIFIQKFEAKYGLSFDKQLLKSLFGTTEMNKIFGEHGYFCDKIRMTGTRLEDSLIMTKAAFMKTMENAVQSPSKSSNAVPRKFSIPNITVLLEHVIHILEEMYPKTIYVRQMSEYYDRFYGVVFDPSKYFSKTWEELFSTTFKSSGKVHLVGENVHLTPEYVKSHNVTPTAFLQEISDSYIGDSCITDSDVSISTEWNSEDDSIDVENRRNDDLDGAIRTTTTSATYNQKSDIPDIKEETAETREEPVKVGDSLLLALPKSTPLASQNSSSISRFPLSMQLTSQFPITTVAATLEEKLLLSSTRRRVLDNKQLARMREQLEKKKQETAEHSKNGRSVYSIVGSRKIPPIFIQPLPFKNNVDLHN